MRLIGKALWWATKLAAKMAGKIAWAVFLTALKKAGPD
jgi:hypothetical protein